MRLFLARLRALLSASIPILMPFARWPAWPFRRSSTRWLRAAAARALRETRSQPDRRDWSAIPRRAWPVLASLPFTVAVVVAAVGLAALAATLCPIDAEPSDLATSALWSVQGAVVAISLSLTLFAYEILPSEWAARRDLALVAAFPSALRLGFALLAITGIALVFAPGDFSGWMRWLSFIGSGLWGLLLLSTFTQIANIRNSDHRLALRRADLRRTTLDTLRVQLLDRAGVHILRERLGLSGGSLAAWISGQSGDSEAQFYRATNCGTVVDVDMVASRRTIDILRCAPSAMLVMARRARSRGRSTQSSSGWTRPVGRRRRDNGRRASRGSREHGRAVSSAIPTARLVRIASSTRATTTTSSMTATWWASIGPPPSSIHGSTA